MAAELKEALDVDSKLIAGGGGIFDVTADGKRIYSKHETGRFPENGEIVNLLRQKS